MRSDMDDDDELTDEVEDWEDTADEADAETEPREVNLFDAAREEDARRPRLRRVAPASQQTTDSNNRVGRVDRRALPASVSIRRAARATLSAMSERPRIGVTRGRTCQPEARERYRARVDEAGGAVDRPRRIVGR